MSNQVQSLHMIDNGARVDYLQRLGNAASIVLLDPACMAFSVPHIDGVIPYRFEAGAAVVFGDPVCSLADRPMLVQEFYAYCKSKNKTVVYVAVSEQFVNWSFTQGRFSALEIGHEIILDPSQDPKALSGNYANLLRRKYNHSIKNGITVKEYLGDDPAVEKAIEQVGVDWLAARKGPQIYIAKVDMFAHRHNKRWFYAEYQGNVVGVLLLNKIEAYQGWVIHVLILSPEAPKTTSEFIALCALDVLREEGCRFFTIGTLPGSYLGRIEGMNSASKWMARKVYKVALYFFKLGERQRYWRKFQPKFEPSFVLINNPRIRLKEIWAIIKAYNASF